ncbi:hypothetical protein EPN52_01130 [bacterium]|nr:MAG: hypothetical protein EPN52_01130 [bacterium]
MNERIALAEHVDLRAAAAAPYAPAATLPAGATSLYGPDVPFGSPAFAIRDAEDITPSALAVPRDAIPGWRALGSLWPGERFIVRIPEDWNGRLVAVGTPAQRSEFACDRFFSDPLLERGYAYVCGNKGQGDGAVLLEPGARFTLDGVTLPRYLLPGGRGISFWQHAPGHTMERWAEELIAITRAAAEVITAVHGQPPAQTFALGLSNGGYEVRRAIEESDLYAGALTWNAVLWTVEHNLLRHLPQAVAAMRAGRPERLEALGFPPDVRGISGASLYEKNFATYWALTAWLHAMNLDPQTSLAYSDVRDPEPAERWNAHIEDWEFDRSPVIAQRVQRYANTGRIRCPLVELASEYDHLIPPALHLEPYARLIARAGRSHLYRSEMLAKAQHVDRWSEDADFPQLELGYPRVLRAFDELAATTAS